MTRTVLAAATALGLAAGCGYSERKMEGPVDITGTVTHPDGKPVKDVQLVLRPKGEGHPAEYTLGPDGAFTVKAVPGEFMFLFQSVPDARDKSKAKAGLAAVPKPYQDVSVDHTVTLKAGSGNEIKLGN